MKKRSKISLDGYKVLSADMGYMIPIGITEVTPGDSFHHSTSALIRLSPLNSPVMHPCHVMIHHWFVPNRLVWDDWKNFITGGPNGTSAPLFPTINTNHLPGGNAARNSLGDYLGVPIGVSNREVSALPFRAYQLIFNECYRDQDLVSPAALAITSGGDSTTSGELQRVAWPKDYSTSARPWEQKGADVSLPLVGNAQVLLDPTSTNAGQVRLASNHTISAADTLGGKATGELYKTGGSTNQVYDPNDTLIVDGSDFEAPNVNELRFAMAWQRVLEARSRFGSRYAELLRAWGVKSDDGELQRPQYLGGGKETIQFSEVLGTADDNLGTLGGHGIGAMRSNAYNKFFNEHGYVISLMFIRPISLYETGIARHWNRRTREEFWQPELQHLGQQAIKNKELYLAHSDPDGTFGYQDRFDELRHGENSVAGEIRGGGIYDTYTLSRAFASPPALNSSFVSCTPTKDIFAVPSEPAVIVMAKHKIKARRLIARSASPSIK